MKSLAFTDTAGWRGEPTGLLTLIILLHVGALWALISGSNHSALSQPAKVVSAFMVQAAPAAPAVAETKPVAPQPAPKPPAPKPVPKPKPKVEPKREAVKPAITLPKEEAAPPPQPAAAPSSMAAPTPAAPPPSEGAATGQAPVTASPPPAQPRTITSGVEYINMPAPKYPPQSRRMGEEGKVVLRVLINERGRADRIEIQQSSGSPRLDQAAREAVQLARFKPYIENGSAIAVFTLVPIAFKLEN